MNRKGFTLVEVIVTIAILGIISGIAYASITGLQTRNKQKKYKAYEQVLLTGAELYVDQYSRDLWSSSTDTTSYCISYNTLVNQSLIQAYKEKGEVISNDSKVKVTRDDGKNNYQVDLKIMSSSNKDKVLYPNPPNPTLSCTKSINS